MLSYFPLQLFSLINRGGRVRAPHFSRDHHTPGSKGWEFPRALPPLLRLQAPLQPSKKYPWHTAGVCLLLLQAGVPHQLCKPGSPSFPSRPPHSPLQSSPQSRRVPRGPHLLCDWAQVPSLLSAHLTPLQGRSYSSTCPSVSGRTKATCPAPTHSVLNFHVTKINQHTQFEGRGGKSK